MENTNSRSDARYRKHFVVAGGVRPVAGSRRNAAGSGLAPRLCADGLRRIAARDKLSRAATESGLGVRRPVHAPFLESRRSLGPAAKDISAQRQTQTAETGLPQRTIALADRGGPDRVRRRVSGTQPIQRKRSATGTHFNAEILFSQSPAIDRHPLLPAEKRRTSAIISGATV